MDLDSLELTVSDLTSEQEEYSEAYSVLEERLENVQATLKEIEDDQVSVSERLVQIEKDDVNARQKGKCLRQSPSHDQALHGKEKSSRNPTELLEIVLCC